MTAPFFGPQPFEDAEDGSLEGWTRRLAPFNEDDGGISSPTGEVEAEEGSTLTTMLELQTEVVEVPVDDLTTALVRWTPFASRHKDTKQRSQIIDPYKQKQIDFPDCNLKMVNLPCPHNFKPLFSLFSYAFRIWDGLERLLIALLKSDIF